MTRLSGQLHRLGKTVVIPWVVVGTADAYFSFHRTHRKKLRGGFYEN